MKLAIIFFYLLVSIGGSCNYLCKNVQNKIKLLENAEKIRFDKLDQKLNLIYNKLCMLEKLNKKPSEILDTKEL